MRVEVTAEDIANGGMTCFDCPVARAMNRVITPVSGDCSAGRGYLNVHEGDSYSDKRWKTPIKVRRFIHRYDMGKPVQPFTFELEDNQ